MRSLLFLGVVLWSAFPVQEARAVAPAAESYFTRQGEVDWDALEELHPVDSDPGELVPSEEDFETPLEELWTSIDPGILDEPKMKIDVFIRPNNIQVQREFLVVWVNGEIRRVGVISSRAGGGMKTASYRAKIQYRQKLSSGKWRYNSWKDKSGKVRTGGIYEPTETVSPFSQPAGKIPYPFKVSYTYAGSAMYWGLQMNGAVWLHSTPHARDLGRPASKGCVRVAFPTAMEIWDIAVNEVEGSVQVETHASGSASAKQAFDRVLKKLARERVVQLVDADYADANQKGLLDAKGDFNGNAHARQRQKLELPACANEKDCFQFFGVRLKTK